MYAKKILAVKYNKGADEPPTAIGLHIRCDGILAQCISAAALLTAISVCIVTYGLIVTQFMQNLHF